MSTWSLKYKKEFTFIAARMEHGARSQSNTRNSMKASTSGRTASCRGHFEGKVAIRLVVSCKTPAILSECVPILASPRTECKPPPNTSNTFVDLPRTRFARNPDKYISLCRPGFSKKHTCRHIFVKRSTRLLARRCG